MAQQGDKYNKPLAQNLAQRCLKNKGIAFNYQLRLFLRETIQLTIGEDNAHQDGTQ